MTLMTNIFNDFDTIEQTAEALNVLKILINYAKTTSADKNEYISDFSKKIYISRNIELTLKSNVSKLYSSKFELKAYDFKIMEQCQLKNFHNLWILISMKKAFLNTINNMVS